MSSNSVVPSMEFYGKEYASGDDIYFPYTEEYWDLPIVRKRHHTAPTKTVPLRAKIIEIYEGGRIKIQLHGNNGFEHDGKFNVIHRGELYCTQPYADTAKLGIWVKNEIPEDLKPYYKTEEQEA